MRAILTSLLLLPSIAIGDTFTCNITNKSDIFGTSRVEISLIVSADSISKKAMLESNDNKHEYDIIHHGNSISMMQIIKDGTLRTLTIDKDLNAVYSMHGFHDGKLINSSQYYGKCKKG